MIKMISLLKCNGFYLKGILFGSLDQYKFQPLIGVQQLSQILSTRSTKFDLSIWNPFPFAVNVGRFKCRFYTTKMAFIKRDFQYPDLIRLFEVNIPWINLQQGFNIWPIHLIDAQMVALVRLLLKNRKSSVRVYVKDIEFIFEDNWSENIDTRKNMSGVHIDWIQDAFHRIDFNVTLPPKFIFKYIPSLPKKWWWPWMSKNFTNISE